MSLQLLAKQIEAKGRKGDSMLVHMTPGEVAGLQKLAESAGGSLSVNPETGLVEAFRLKELLPFIVGAGVTAATGGAASPLMLGLGVGGFEALRTGDIGKGAMAGFGAYGGAGLAGGLMGAGAASVGQAAGNIAGPIGSAEAGLAANQAVAAQSPLQLMGQGAKGLLTKDGGASFMQNMGGIGGLAKSAGMAAAPMLMSQEQKMADAPVDDEMYSYTFDPGRTGAEGTPTDSTAERRFLGNEFSPVRKHPASAYPVYAAQGGLMSLAEGGETAAEAAAPTASEAALAYLMGERSSSAGLPAMRAPSASNIGVGADNMYAFNPATGTFLRNPNVAGATSDAVRGPVGTSFAGSGGDGYQPPAPNPDFDTPEKQAAYYATRPNQANITGIAQDLFGMTPLGKLQAYLDPEGVAASRATVQQAPADVVNRQGMADVFPGQTPFLDPQQRAEQQANTYDYNQAGGYDPSSGQSYAESVGMGGDYGYSGYSSGEDRGEAAGGLITLAKGGMASGGFVVPADVVSALGNGSTDAGLRKLYAMTGSVKPIKGKGDGLSDSIPTDIDGKQPARVADGEAYIDPKTVKRLGGAKKLYAMMDKIRAQAHGKTTQQRKVNPARVMA